jgi:GMP synthase PP-ATPase subunit
LYDKVWQAGAILLPVGVMGDERTYEKVVAPCSGIYRQDDRGLGSFTI